VETVRLTPDQVLSQAARILRSDPGLLEWWLETYGMVEPLLKVMRITPTLNVSYRSGEPQSWGGPPGDWKDHVEYYGIEGHEIERFDVTIERHLHGEWDYENDDNDPLRPAKVAMQVLREEGFLPPPPKKKAKKKRKKKR
jgi:hypothetical protein